MKERIVLAYSGGFDATVAIPWLAETLGAEVVTLSMDLGQGGELDEVRERALAAGAVRAHVLDVREELARDYVLRALQAGAQHDGRYPMATALGHALVARKLVEIAAIEQAGAVAHGSSSPRHDRIDTGVRALNPSIRVIAPARDWGMAPENVIEYARARRLPVPAPSGLFRADSNLWGRTIELGALDTPGHEPAAGIYTLTRSAADAANTPASVEIAFERGVPTAVNGVAMSFVELIDSLTTIAGHHGIGRLENVETRAGDPSRRTCEAPAAVVLHTAHRELQRFVSSTGLERLVSDLSLRYADLVEDGLWFTPMREALDAFTAKVQERVTGVIRVRLFKGVCTVTDRRSPYAPSDPAPAGTGERILA